MKHSIPYDVLEEAMKKLSHKERWAVFQNHARLKAFAVERNAEIAANTYTVPLEDDLVPKIFQDELRVWREMLQGTGYRHPVAWRQRYGFDIKQHGNLAGHCYRQLECVERYKFVNNTPTTDSIVFWCPELVQGSGNKTVAEMINHRHELRERHRLPAHHCQSFGSISELFSLIFAYNSLTGERAPFFGNYAVSDTVLTDGTHAAAGAYGDDGLHCAAWNGDWHNYGYGFWLFGKEELKK